MVRIFPQKIDPTDSDRDKARLLLSFQVLTVELSLHQRMISAILLRNESHKLEATLASWVHGNHQILLVVERRVSAWHGTVKGPLPGSIHPSAEDEVEGNRGRGGEDRTLRVWINNSWTVVTSSGYFSISLS